MYLKFIQQFAAHQCIKEWNHSFYQLIFNRMRLLELLQYTFYCCFMRQRNELSLSNYKLLVIHKHFCQFMRKMNLNFVKNRVRENIWVTCNLYRRSYSDVKYTFAAALVLVAFAFRFSRGFRSVDLTFSGLFASGKGPVCSLPWRSKADWIFIGFSRASSSNIHSS